MSNERPIGEGIVTITSNYQYILGYMQANMLKFQADFSHGGWTRQELDIIRSELEETAKFFAEEQGLNKTITDLSINGTGVEIGTGNSGKLYGSIKARIKGDSVLLSANAKNSRNQYYAGHIEYGFHDRAGKFVPARPFLRPALYAVSESSKGRIVQSLRELIESTWQDGGYLGYSNIKTFGRLRRNSGGIREFYKQNRYGANSGLKTKSYYEKTYNLNSKNNNFRQRIRQGILGKKLSVDRYDSRNRRDKNSFTVRTKRTKPLRAKTKKEKKFTLRRRRIKEGRNRLIQRRKERTAKKREEKTRKNVLEKYKSGKPISTKEMKYLTKDQNLEHMERVRDNRIQDGTLRDYSAERARAKSNSNEIKQEGERKKESREKYKKSLKYNGVVNPFY